MKNMTSNELQNDLNQESRDWANIGKFSVNVDSITLNVAPHLSKLYGVKLLTRDINKDELDKANAYTVDDLMQEFIRKIISYK